MSEFFDENLIGEFVAESREHLDAIEPDLLAMEASEEDVSQELINRVFRAIHSIKGGAGFLAYESLKSLSHTMESVLVQIRDGAYSLSPEIANVLLSGVDKLRAMVDDIESSDDVPCEDEISQLQAIHESNGKTTKGKKAKKPKKAAAKKSKKAAAQVRDLAVEFQQILSKFEEKKSEVKAKLERGLHVYCSHVRMKEDVRAKKMTLPEYMQSFEKLGDCLAATVDLSDPSGLEEAFESEESFSFVFSTVLEQDLIGSALDLPPEQILPIDLSFLDGGDDSDSEPPEAGQDKSSATKNSEKEETKAVTTVAETLRVRVDLLSRLMNVAGELVLGRNQLLRALGSDTEKSSALAGILQNIDRVTTEIQEGIMQTRMQPIGSVFGKFPRVVRDLSQQLGKEIAINVTGSEVELDKSILELLGDPLTHIIRNCCDHAIETPDIRTAAGKDPKGTITLEAYHEAGQVNVRITDDGAGIDPKKVGAKAVDKGLISAEQAAEMSQRDLVNLVFAPGFSMAAKVSDVSGRGVGMDVVRSNVERLGGMVSLDSTHGEGTIVLLQLPLTLAIIPSLIVGVSDSQFAIPQVNVDEFVWVRSAEVADRIEHMRGVDVLKLRGSLLPLVRLSDVLDIQPTFIHSETGERLPDQRKRIADRRSPSDEAPEQEHAEADFERGEDRRKDWRGDYNIVVLKFGTNQFGLIVDELFDTEETVVKPLSCFVKQCKCFSGATILGDGHVITILDVAGIVSEAELRFSELETEERRQKEEDEARLAEAAKARRSIILFRSAETEYFAVPQEEVLRLERISPDDIQEVGDREFIEYLGRGLPIVRLDKHLSVRPLDENLQEIFLIIPRSNGAEGQNHACAGLMASEIIDALDVEVDLDPAGDDSPGLAGSALVNNQLTLFLNLQELLESTQTS